MYSRTIKVKTTNINHELIVSALIEDGEPIHQLLSDDIHLYQDSNADNFASLEKACLQLKIPYDSYYKTSNEFDHGNWLHYRPANKTSMFIQNIRETFPSYFIDLTNC